MSTLLKPISVRNTLLEHQLRIFTIQEFNRLFPTSPWVSKYFLERQVHQGLLTRLKKGLYALKTDPPREEEVANKLYQPSYISFAYALSHYNILPEAPYTITSATTKPTRLFTTDSLSFAYYTIKVTAYTGYRLLETDSIRYLIAEPEKALVDYLYFHCLPRTQFPALDRLNLTSLNPDKVRHYVQIFARHKLVAIINHLYAKS